MNLGAPEDHRVPDAALLAPGPAQVWHDTAVPVVEVLSPDDESLAELGFHGAHGVQEVVLVDADSRTVRVVVPSGGERARSEVLGRTTGELEQAVRWPEA